MPRSEEVSVVVSIDSNLDSQFLTPRSQPSMELVDASSVEYVEGNAQFNPNIQVNLGSEAFTDGPIILDESTSNGGELVIQAQSPILTGIPGDLIFSVTGGQQVIRITASGDFYVCDRLVTNDTDIYWAFKRFLGMAFGDYPVPTPVEVHHMIPLSKDGILTRSERVLEEISKAQDTPQTDGSGS